MRLTVLKEIVALVFTSFAIGSFVSDVSRNAELLDSLGGHLPGQNRVNVAKLGPRIVARDVSCVIVAL